MRSGSIRRVGVGAVALTLAGVLATSPLRGDDRGLLGRLFRLGGGGGGGGAAAAPGRPDPSPRESGSTVSREVPRAHAPAHPAAADEDPLAPGPATNAPALPAPRILPHARVSRPVTEADPLVTRITLARSSDGHPFGMFLQVHADGTVIDSAGVHTLDREAVRGVVAALESTDLSRLCGHCGGPPTDFVETVQMIVFDRGLGRLRATSFSFSGNTQGCDAGVRRLQAALDALQSRLDPPTTAPTTPPGATPRDAHPAAVSSAPAAALAPPPDVSAPPPPLSPLPAPGAAVEPIPLTAPAATELPPIRLNEAGPTR